MRTIICQWKKTVCTALLFLLATTYSVAAPRPSYSSYLKDGRVWEYISHHFEFKDEYGVDYDEIVTTVRYLQHGDTVIEGKEYCKFYRQEDESAWEYDRAIREEGSTAYCVLSGNSLEDVLIELDPDRLDENTTLWFMLKMDPLESVDSISVGGRLFVRHNYMARKWVSDIPYIAVEGVGFSLEALILGMPKPEPTRIHDYIWFRALYEDGECIFSFKDFSAPAVHDYGSGVGNLPVTAPSDGIYHDLQGRRLSGHPTRGLYIRDGKKVLLTK